MYYTVKRISNSDLQIAKHLIMGTPLQRPKSAFHFGSALHEALLEPEKFHISHHRGVNTKLLYQCIEVLRKERECLDLMEGSREQEVYWTDFYTKVECKSKLDIYKKDMVIDIKTTRARTQLEFEDCIKAYEYDRQMAFYADSVIAAQVVLIGVSKSTGNIFIFRQQSNSEFITVGRAKYRYILLKIKQLNLFEQIWHMRENG
jgi:hypothetical protein